MIVAFLILLGVNAYYLANTGCDDATVRGCPTGTHLAPRAKDVYCVSKYGGDALHWVCVRDVR